MYCTSGHYSGAVLSTAFLCGVCVFAARLLGSRLGVSVLEDRVIYIRRGSFRISKIRDHVQWNLSTDSLGSKRNENGRE